MRRRALFGVVTVLLVVAVVEAASCVFFQAQEDQYSFYDPARYLLEDDELQKLADSFDPTLGWKKRFPTPHGERPREADFGRPLLATFGDSYTYCDDVADDETWQTYLGRLTRRDVLNFGTNGFGPDQAYLRFLEDQPGTGAPVVTLGLTTDNIKRVVNVYRKFFYRNTGIPATKPRFVLDGDALRLIENPVQRLEDLRRLQDPDFLATIGAHDLWYNRNDFPRLAFPYTRILFNRSFWLEVRHGKLGNRINDIDPRPWADLWAEQDARAVVFGIFDLFVQEARRRGVRPIIMILPKKSEVRYRVQQGRHRPSIRYIEDFTRARGYETFNAVEALASEATTPSALAALYDGHVNARGNRLIARHLLQHLVAHGHVEAIEPDETR